MATKTSTYLSTFERLDRGRGNEPAWLRATRRAAAAAFGRLGFPTTRDEEWRFTNVSPIADTAFAPAPPSAVGRAEIERFLIPGVEGPVLVFVDGRYAAGLSTAPRCRQASPCRRWPRRWTAIRPRSSPTSAAT